ncbi:MAG: glucokinase [Rhodobacteraceae bacterium]|nr:glucokinase [Paracoccaceae bacterium]
MTILVADVGGTNSRLALVDGAAPHSLMRYTNTGFASFYDILRDYCSGRNLSGLTAVCVAIAGPVTSTRAQLTNLNWQFDTQDIAAALPGCGPVRLVNDLVALGHALAGLEAEHLSVIKPLGTAQLNNQALVVGIGTGFNVCLVKDTEKGRAPLVVEAELGHASLPQSVWAVLSHEIGDAAMQINANEDLFSGRGLSRLHKIISGGVNLPGAEIVGCYGGNTDATQAVDLMAQLLGILARELVFQYLPLNGIYFAGSAAWGIFATDARLHFLKAFDRPGQFSDLIGQVPVKVITDDAAALLGAARYVSDS